MSGNSHEMGSSASSAADHPMARLLEQYPPTSQLERGQVVPGVVVRIAPEVVVIDVGAKCEGTVSGRELERVDPELLASLEPGDEVPAYILHPEGPSGEVVLSLARAQQEKDWRRAHELLEDQKTVELEAIGYNKGGILVRLGSIRGFVPASQLATSRDVPRISDPASREALANVVGRCLQLQVIEANQERNRLILSERVAMSQRREEEEHQFLASLEEGEVRKGKISNLTDFGAFVNLGPVDGLLHLSEISWQPVKHPSDLLQIGQELEVLVLSVDQERRQVSLSRKQLESDPWTTVGARYEEGQLVEGQITRLTDWGAFARIVGDEAIEGLIHISELDERRVAHPREVVQSGDVVTLRVVRVEPDRHRMGLSLKRVAEGERADADWEADYEASGQPPLESPMASAFDEARRG
ncbi:MAG: S1 RNA-binding domain-containing protein [Anaerolineae bacterium]|jgi:small subunit ribosomal protein S1